MKFLLSVFAISFGLAFTLPQVSSQAAHGLPLEVSTSCDEGTAVFKVVNLGKAFPSSVVFNIFRVNVDKVVSKRRMNLGPGQSATFKLKNADKIAGEIGLFMDPQWAPREREIDASVRCSV